MRRLAGVLVLLVLLLVVVDRVAWYVAQQKLADEIQRSQRLVETPDVSIKGFPFLTQALRGNYEQVDGTVRYLQVRKGVNLNDLDVQLRGVHVTLSDLVSRHVTGAPVDRADAQALVSYPTLDAAARANLPGNTFDVNFGPAPNNRLAVRGTFRSTGLNGTLNGLAQVKARNGNLVVSLAPESFADVPGFVRDQLGSLIDRSYTLPELPFGFRARSVTTGGDGVRVTAGAADVTLGGNP